MIYMFQLLLSMKSPQTNCLYMNINAGVQYFLCRWIEHICRLLTDISKRGQREEEDPGDPSCNSGRRLQTRDEGHKLKHAGVTRLFCITTSAAGEV